MDDALHLLGSQKVLPKRIKVNLSSEPTSYQRSQHIRAPHAISMLRHPNLVALLDWRCLRVERAMGIEPTRAALPGLGNKRFGAVADPKCD
jgi:hypothetical protein